MRKNESIGIEEVSEIYESKIIRETVPLNEGFLHVEVSKEDLRQDTIEAAVVQGVEMLSL
jgi:hypothetical protein